MALMHVNFFSKSLGMCVAVDVILPQRARKQIGMAASAREGLHPTLYLLHGMSDNHTIWQRRTSIERYVSDLGLAVVMPNAHLSSYTNMAHGLNYFDYVADELPQTMREFFPLSDKREENFIAGLSMGGAGCLKIGLARPERFCAIGCLSAGISNQRGPSDDPAWIERQTLLHGGRDLTGTEEDRRYNARRIIEEGLPAPRIYHSCGKDDALVARARETRDFFQSFPGNPFDYVYEEDPGDHTWDYWDDHIQNFLRYIKLPELKGLHQ